MSLETPDKPDVIFILSVDTEEEWDWLGELPQNNYSVSNVRLLPKLQHLCEQIGIRPTYFTDYAVANDTEAAGILKAMVDRDTCEIGAHLHPWCNPPFYGKTTEKESHIVNLPISRVEEKLDNLLELLVKTFGTAPNAFRSGRWGVNGDVLGLLEKKAFK